MRSLAAIPRTFITLLSGVVATIAITSIIIVIAWFKPNSPLIERLIGAWSNAWLVPAGCSLEVSGSEHIDRRVSYVVVANHLSNFDVMVCFLAIPLPIRYLAKKELFKIPLLTTAMRSIGIVEVDRQARGANIESVNAQAARTIAFGDSLIIYPEGTRSRSGNLQPFRKGAFTMAAAAGMPVLPVTIHGTWEMWQPGKKTIRPGVVRVVIDPPIETTGLDREGVERLRADTRELISQRFEQLRSEAALVSRPAGPQS